MQEISVEGHEILEWLQQRNKVKPDWAHKLKVSRLKLSEVIHGLKSANIPEIRENLSKEKREKEVELNYGDLLEIQEKLLKSKEAETRTMFGGYASPHIKNVQALIKLYQKENLHVVSLAHEMSQIITFDLVAAKKNTKSYENQITDLNIKIGVFQNSTKNSRHEIVKLAKRYTTDFEIEESIAEKLDCNDLINRYVNQFGKKAYSIIKSLNELDVPRICSYYCRFSQVNSLKELPSKYFDLLVWLRKEGDTLVSDFNNQNVTNNIPLERLYEEILSQKGYKVVGGSSGNQKG